jgi:hypothetical protein
MPAASKLRPTDPELRQLYEVDGLTAQAIADRCQVEKITALRWLKAAGIERRPTGIGLAHRGITAPTADELRAMVHDQHLSYREIAEHYGVDFTAVPYWLKKHGIPKPTVWGTRRRGQVVVMPTREELRRRREAGEPIRSIALDVGVAHGTIGALCRKYGITVDDPGWDETRRHACLDGHAVRSTYEQKVDDWLHEHGLAHEYEPQYPFDRRYKADFLVGRAYVEVWGVTRVEAYEARRRLKIERCKAEGLHLIQVSHERFDGRRRWWAPLLPLLEDAATSVS